MICTTSQWFPWLQFHWHTELSPLALCIWQSWVRQWNCSHTNIKFSVRIIYSDCFLFQNNGNGFVQVGIGMLFPQKRTWEVSHVLRVTDMLICIQGSSVHQPFQKYWNFFDRFRFCISLLETPWNSVIFRYCKICFRHLEGMYLHFGVMKNEQIFAYFPK